LTGKEKKSPRQVYFYFSDDGDVLAIRMDNWKVSFMEQRTPGGLDVWKEPFVRLRAPNLYNLRTDPFRVRKDHVQHLQRMDVPARLPDLRGASNRGTGRRDVQGAPGDPETQQFYHRRRDAFGLAALDDFRNC